MLYSAGEVRQVGRDRWARLSYAPACPPTCLAKVRRRRKPGAKADPACTISPKPRHEGVPATFNPAELRLTSRAVPEHRLRASVSPWLNPNLVPS